MLKKYSHIVAWLAFCLLLVYFTFNYYAFPGVNPEHPLGYFGWYDQGQYLRQLKNLMSNGAVALSTGVYPPGYAIVSSPVASLLEFFIDDYAEYGTIASNYMLVVLSVFILSKTMPETKAVTFLLFLSATLIFLESFRNSLVIPWSSSVSLLTISVFYYIVRNRVTLSIKVKDKSVLLFYGVLLSILLHTRPQDFAIVSFLSFIYLLISLHLYKDSRQNLYIPILSFVALECLFYLLANGMAFGSMYANTQHSFSIVGAHEKLIGLVSGDQSYGVSSRVLVDEGARYAVFVVAIFLSGIVFGNYWVKALLVLWFSVYLSFSDFGPHNFLRFELFHYLKTPFVLAITVLISEFTYRKFLMLSALVLSLSLLRVQFSFSNILYDPDISTAEEGLWRVEANEYLDGVFISGLVPNISKQSQDIFFSPPSLRINGKSALAFKDYRVFAGKTGIYIHFFKDQTYLKQLEIDTSRIKINPNVDFGIFGFNRRLGLK